jgi:hypothetical protein
MALCEVHCTSLKMATDLTMYQVKNPVAPLDVIRRLTRITPNAVLVGTYGFVGWMREPRAEQTVEVVVAPRFHRKATDQLLRAFPRLEVDRQEAATHFSDKETEKLRIRVLKPLERRYRAALRRTYSVRCKGCYCRIPSLEMALLLTYVPMMTLPRNDPDKYQNAHDFILLAKVNLNIEWKRLRAIAAAVCPDSADDLLERVRAVQAGEPLRLPNSILPHDN